MSIVPANIIIGLSPETIAVLSDLASAIRSISGTTIKGPITSGTAVDGKKAESPASKEDAAKAEDKKEDAVIYWFSSASGKFGEVVGEEAFAALKKKDAKTVKWTQDKYEKAVKKAADEAAAAKAAAADSDDDEGEVPSLQDVIDAFGAYLPSDLDKAERAVRAGFVKPMLARFGAGKASELPEEHRRLAINLVQRKAAGQDVDPETSEFEEFEAEDESLV